MNIKVAIVDDNSFLITAIKEKLSFFENISIKHTSLNGSELLIKLEDNHNIDVILMDIRMPDLNGFEVSEIIQQTTDNKNTPITATSAEKLAEHEKSMFTDFLLKPISPIDLSNKIRAYCNKKETIIFNKQQALEFAYNDSEIMQKLISMFIIELPQQICLLLSTIQQQNHSESLLLIHKLRGSCKTCGAMDLDTKLNQLHQFISANNHHKSISFLTDIENAKDDFLELIDKIID